MYGLVAAALNLPTQTRLDAFQLKGLHKILSVPTTFQDRTCSNKYVFHLANAAIEGKGGATLIPLSQNHKQRRIYFLSKLLCLGDNDPAATATMITRSLEHHDYGTKRVGGPRKDWLDETVTDMWESITTPTHQQYRNKKLDRTNIHHQQILREYAKIMNQTYHFTERD